MIYKITKQNTGMFIVDDSNLRLWLEIEKRSGLTYGEIDELRRKGSLTANAWVMFCGASIQGETELKTLEAWLTHEFEDFDIEDADPKESTAEASSDD